jgi:cytochrome oxidase Cu insertion factor (SCO1/SenC/PrrC family)
MGRKIGDIDGGIENSCIGGHWQLKDINGKPFGSQDLDGHYYLLFFGTTRCPDVCPLTLDKMMKVHRKVERSSEGKQYCKFVPVFVGVDPKKDSAASLKKFRDTLYGEELLILTDSDNQSADMQSMLKKFRVPVGLTDEEEAKAREFFKKQGDDAGLLGKLAFWRQDNSLDSAADGYLNDHSRAIYLMAADNKFLTFFPLSITEDELKH